MKTDLKTFSTRDLLWLWIADLAWIRSPKNDGRLSSGSSADLDYRWDEMEAVEAVLRERYASIESARVRARAFANQAGWWLGRQIVSAYTEWSKNRGVRSYVANRYVSEVKFPARGPHAMKVTMTVQNGSRAIYSREELVRMLDEVVRGEPTMGAYLKTLIAKEIVKHGGGLGMPEPLYLLAHWLDVPIQWRDMPIVKTLNTKE